MTAASRPLPAFKADSLPHAPATRLEQDLEAHMSPDWFSKDGKGTIILESLLGVGYVVAAALHQPGERALRLADLLQGGSEPRGAFRLLYRHPILERRERDSEIILGHGHTLESAPLAFIPVAPRT